MPLNLLGARAPSPASTTNRRQLGAQSKALFWMKSEPHKLSTLTPAEITGDFSDERIAHFSPHSPSFPILSHLGEREITPPLTNTTQYILCKDSFLQTNTEEKYRPRTIIKKSTDIGQEGGEKETHTQKACGVHTEDLGYYLDRTVDIPPASQRLRCWLLLIGLFFND